LIRRIVLFVVPCAFVFDKFTKLKWIRKLGGSDCILLGSWETYHLWYYGRRG